MKVLNFWITLFGSLFLVGLIIAGFLLFKLVTFVQHTDQRIQDLQTKTSNALNLQKQVCGNGSLSKLLANAGNYCQ